MSKKKKNSSNLLVKILGFIIGAIAVSFFLSFILASELEYQEIMNIEALSSKTFSSALPVCVAASLLAAILIFSGSSKEKEMKGKDELEDQHFMDKSKYDKELKHCFFDELYSINVEGWPVHTQLIGKRMKIWFGPKYHMLVIGATGSGKTETFVNPSIQILSESKTHPSFFITDTKGELYAQHSKKLEKDGYDIKVIDLTDPYRSTQWNPLEKTYDNYQRALHIKEEVLVHSNDDVSKYNYIKVGDISNEKWYEFDRKAFASLEQTLSEVEVERTKLLDGCFDDIKTLCLDLCPTDKGEKDPTWSDGARSYIQAILLAMLEDSANPELGMTREKFNFYNMYKLAMNKENNFETMENYFKGRSELSQTKQLTSHMIGTKAQQTRDSFLSTIATKIAMFSDNGLCFLTSKNEVDFYDFDERPTALFIKIPDENKIRYTLATVCIGQAYKEFVRKARANEFSEYGKAELKRPLYYIMDEFANLPPISDISAMVTVARSRRIYLMLAIQAYSQLEGVYGKDIAGTIRSNCNGEIYIGTGDLDTREQFSKKLGNYTIKVDSQGSQKGADGKDQKSFNTQFQQRPLVYASDLAHMEFGHIYEAIYPMLPMDNFIDSKFTAPHIYTLGKREEPFIPGRRLDEDAIYYDVHERNKKILGV